MVGGQHARGAAAMRLDAVEPVPAANVEEAVAANAELEIDVGLAAQHLGRDAARRDDAMAEIDLMVPGQRIDPRAQRGGRIRLGGKGGQHAWLVRGWLNDAHAVGPCGMGGAHSTRDGRIARPRAPPGG